MKKMTLKWALMTMALSSVFFSCQKEASVTTPGCNISMAGLSGSYKLTALQYKSSATATPMDYFTPLEDCEKDDILVLKADGTYKNDDAGTVCEPSGTSEGGWKLNGNTLISEGILNGTIVSYDCKTLVYYLDNTLKEGDRLTFTLTKQ